MNKKTWGVFIASGFCIASAFAQQFKLTDKIGTAPDVKIGKLPNGLTYYIKKNKKPEKRVELRLVVNAGSVLEDDNQKGLAHFMEHMNFNGSKHFPKNELVNYLQSIGVKFGADLNAYTSFDETVYMLPIPSEKPEVLEQGFNVIEDWAGQALLTDEEIEKERGVVLEELRSGKGAGERMQNKYFPKLFNGSKYADRLPIGTEENLKTFKPEVIRKFYKDWYRPDLMAVIVVGDIEVADAEAKIKAHFSHFTNPTNERPRPNLIPVKPRTVEEAFAVSDKEGEQTQIQIINYVRPGKKDITWGDYRKTLVKGIYTSILNQRLQELTQKPNPPFLFAFSGLDGFVRGYESYASSAIMGKGDVKVAIKALLEENERVRKFGFTNDEVERAKKDQLNDYEETLKEKDKTTSSRLLGEYIRNFLEGEVMPGIDAEFAFLKQVMPTITTAEVNAVSKELNDPSQKPFVLITGPEQRDVAIPSDAELLALIHQAEKSEVKAYEEKKIASSLMDKAPTGGELVSQTEDKELGTTTLTLKNGVTVTLKPTTFKNDEIVFSGLRYGGSSLYGNEDKENASFASTIVREMGIKDFTPIDLQKFMSGKTASVNPYISEIDEGFSGRSSVKDLETCMQMLYLSCTAPRKDEDLFKSFVTKNATMITSMKENPNLCFRDTLTKVMSQNNPRTMPILMKQEDFDRIKLDRVLQIYNDKFGNVDGFKFYFVGSFDVETIKPLIVSYLGSLPSKPTTHNFKDLGIRPPSETKFTFKKGKEPKSLVVINYTGETAYNPDVNLKLQAATEILQIKMTEKLREELGGVYSTNIRGSVSRVPYGKFSISANIPCGPENVDKLILATKALIAKQKSEGPSEEDLKKVKEQWKKKYEEDIKTNNYWLNIFASSFISETSPNRALTYLSRVEALTVKDVQAVTQEFFNDKNCITAILMPE